MKTSTLNTLTLRVTIGLSLTVCSHFLYAQPAGTSTQMSEPARWTQEDVTPAQKMRTATTEAVNAHQQFLDECKRVAAPQVAACVAETHMNYEKEMAEIGRRFGNNPPSAGQPTAQK